MDNISLYSEARNEYLKQMSTWLVPPVVEFFRREYSSIALRDGKKAMSVFQTYCACFRYLEQCEIVFPFINGHGKPIMATGKNHSIRHTPGDVARYFDAINVSCDAPEEEHKLWVKEQGVCTNQGPQAQLSMMLHSLHKEASALLCKAVHGKVCVFLCILIFEDQRHILHICQILHIFSH